MCPKRVLIKRGEYGVIQFSADSVFAVPAFPLEEVFDPTGAGDTFAGGFMGELARSKDHSEAGLRRAIVYGSVMASLVAEDLGMIRLRTLTEAALAAGFDRAAGAVIATLDGDLQNDPADIAALLAKLEAGYDLVAGWRVPRQDPLVSRRIPSLVANALIGWITGVRLHDYGCTL